MLDQTCRFAMDKWNTIMQMVLGFVVRQIEYAQNQTGLVCSEEVVLFRGHI